MKLCLCPSRSRSALCGPLILSVSWLSLLPQATIVSRLPITQRQTLLSTEREVGILCESQWDQCKKVLGHFRALPNLSWRRNEVQRCKEESPFSKNAPSRFEMFVSGDLHGVLSDLGLQRGKLSAHPTPCAHEVHKLTPLSILHGLKARLRGGGLKRRKQHTKGLTGSVSPDLVPNEDRASRAALRVHRRRVQSPVRRPSNQRALNAEQSQNRSGTPSNSSVNSWFFELPSRCSCSCYASFLLTHSSCGERFSGHPRIFARNAREARTARAAAVNEARTARAVNAVHGPHVVATAK